MDEGRRLESGHQELRRDGFHGGQRPWHRSKPASRIETGTQYHRVFTGDNGGQDRFRSPEHPRGFFGPNVHPLTGGTYRGGKGNLY